MNTGPILQNGSTGVEVKRLQRILVMLKLLDYRGIDGIFTASEPCAAALSAGPGLTHVTRLPPVRTSRPMSLPPTPTRAHP